MTLPLALRGDLGLGASAAGGIYHQRELHQRMTAISELVVLAVLHSRQLKWRTDHALVLHYCDHMLLYLKGASGRPSYRLSDPHDCVNGQPIHVFALHVFSEQLQH